MAPSDSPSVALVSVYVHGGAHLEEHIWRSGFFFSQVIICSEPVVVFLNVLRVGVKVDPSLSVSLPAAVILLEADLHLFRQKEDLRLSINVDAAAY